MAPAGPAFWNTCRFSSHRGRVFASVGGAALIPELLSSGLGFWAAATREEPCGGSRVGGEQRGSWREGRSPPPVRLNGRGLTAPHYCHLRGSDFTVHGLGGHEHSDCVSWSLPQSDWCPCETRRTQSCPLGRPCGTRTHPLEHLPAEERGLGEGPADTLITASCLWGLKVNVCRPRGSLALSC